MQHAMRNVYYSKALELPNLVLIPSLDAGEENYVDIEVTDDRVCCR